MVGQIELEYQQKAAYTCHVWNYKAGDYDKFRLLLTKGTVNEMCIEFAEMFLLIASECVSNYTCTVRPRDKHK